MTFNRLFLIPVWACLLSLSAYSQNNCSTAIPIGTIPYSSPTHTAGFPTANPGYTTCGTTDDYGPAAACGNASATGQDAVFSYIPVAGKECVTLTLNGPGIGVPPILNAAASLFIYKGCPGAAGSTCVDRVANTTGGISITLKDIKLTPGDTYYFVVDGGSACYPYQLKVDPGNCTPGVSCKYPIEITFPYENIPGSTLGMVNDFTPTTGCIRSDNLGEDIVYHFTLTNKQCFRYKVDNMSADGTMYITKGCPGATGTTCVRTSNCAMPYCNGIVEEVTLDAGDYYIVIKSNLPNKELKYNLTFQSLNPDNGVDCITCNDQDNCAPCKNTGFEKMSFEGWTGGYGSYGNPGATTGFRTGPLNDGLTRHTIVTRGHFDSLITALPVVAPDGGDYAVRLGNCNNNYQAEQISYTFVVDSNNTNFIYRYAVVLEDPGHGQSEQPYFSINMKVGSTQISCAKYEVFAKPGLDGFSQGMASPVNPGTAPESATSEGSTMYWKNWTTVNIPLLNYIGQTATITFTTKDCNAGAHFGYAYVDAECQRLDIIRDSNLFCHKDTVKLTAPLGFKTYKWSTGETTRSIEVTKKGIYKVTCTTVTGCVIELEAKILIEEAPIPDFSWEYNCKDSIVTFKDESQPVGGNPITTWSWYFGDGDSSHVQHPKHFYDSSATYDVHLIVATEGGCAADTIIGIPVDVYMPQGELNAIDTIRLCEGEDLHLQADTIELTEYEWKGPTGFSSTQISPTRVHVVPADSGWYYVHATIKDCVEKDDSTYVIIEPKKKPYICPDTVICLGDKAKLYSGGGKTCRWSPGKFLSDSMAFNPTCTPTTTIRYNLYLYNDLCPDTMLTVEVKPLSGVVGLELPDSIFVCKDEDVFAELGANGFDVFKWKGPNSYVSMQKDLDVPRVDQYKVGKYTVDATISNNKCLSGKDSIYIGLYPDPKVTIDPKNITYCKGDSGQMVASGAKTYEWSPNQYLSNYRIANPWFKPPASKQYSVIGTDIHGCKGYDTAFVTVKPLPQPNAGPDITFCIGDSAYIKLTQKYDSLLWSTGETTDSILVDTTVSISVTVYSNGCTGSDAMNVKVVDPGTFTLGPDTLLCIGNSYATNIVFSNPDSVIWQDDVRTLNRNIDTAGQYIVSIYVGKCLVTDTIIVSFDSIPVFSLGPDSTVCKGTAVTFSGTAKGALRYQWDTSPTDTTNAITVSNTGTFALTVYSIRCQYTDTVSLLVMDPPNPELGPEQFICDGDSVYFQSDITADKYLWNRGDTTKGFWAKNDSLYTLTVVIGPCTRFDSVRLHVQIPKTFSLGPDIHVCEDQSVTIYGPSGFDSYLWNTGATTQDIPANSTGTYSLYVTDKLCDAADTINVLIDTIPEFEFPEGPTICRGDSAVLTSPITASNYLWSTFETTSSITVKDEGLYTLYIQNGLCHFEDTIEVFVVDPPALNIGPDSIVCVGTGVSFGQVVPNATSYLWNNGSTDPVIRDTTEGIYSVVVNYSVCVLKDTAELVVTDMPSPYLGPDQHWCEGTVVNLFANTFGEQFIWNTPANGNNATVTREGTYIVVVKNGRCQNSDTINITYQPQHQVVLPPDVVLCSGEKYDIVAITNCQDPVFNWNTGETLRDITVHSTGDYILSVSYGVCVAIDTIHVQVNPLPAVEPIYALICPDDSAAIHLPEAYSYYHISSGEPFTETMLYPQMEYNLMVYDSAGCKFPTSIKGERDPDCDRDVYVPNTFTPNHDGANDMFKVEAYNLKLVQLLIFDRWGHMLFDTDDPARGWDGRFKGNICKTDVYEWKLIYENAYGKRKTKMGHVNLLK